VGWTGSSAASFAPLNLLLANLTVSDQRIHACLRQPLPSTVHAEAERFCFNPILTTMLLVVVGASLLHGLAIGIGALLGMGFTGPNRDNEERQERRVEGHLWLAPSSHVN
jgi:hypothetical protein